MLTERQCAFWRKALAALEAQIAYHFQKFPDRKPDGSFVMEAFDRGYELGKRERKKRGKSGRKK